MFKKCAISAIAIILFILQFSFAWSLDISSVSLYSDDNGGTTTPATAMTPSGEMTLAFTLDSFVAKELSITIYNSGLTTEAACYNTDSRLSADRCAWIEWKNISGENLFTDIRPTQTTWQLDKPNSLIATSGQSRIVFTPAKSSRYSADSEWIISITVRNETSSAIESLTINNSHYIELTPSVNSSSFRPGKAGSTDRPLATITSCGYSQTYIPFIVISNAPYSWKIKAVDFTGGSGIPLSGDSLASALSDTTSRKILNTSFQDFEISLDPTKESGTQKNIFLWLDYPSGDPDTTYASTLSLEAYITANPSISSGTKTISLNGTTDNLAPVVNVASPVSLAWAKSGRTISYSANIADSLSGFMDAISAKKCSVYFDGALVSQSTAVKNPTYKTCRCSGTFIVPETGNKNVNLNFTIEDMSGNLAYNDSVWLQIDLSSLYIRDISLVSTEKPYDADWYFLPSDTFRIIGTIKNSVGDAVASTVSSYLAVTSSGVTINSNSASSSSPYEYSSTGNIDLDFDYSGASVGNAVIHISARDQMNNTALYNRTVYITNYVNSVRILTNFSGRIYTEGQNISFDIMTNTVSDPAYMSNITAILKSPTGSAVETKRANADTSGRASFKFYLPEFAREYYDLEIIAMSPLDTSTTVSNTTTIDTEWLEISVESESDGYIDNGETKKISASGTVYYSEDIGNETLVNGATVTCELFGPGIYNQSCTTSVDANAEYSCDCWTNVTLAGRYDFEISAEKEIDDFTIRGWNKDEYLSLTNISGIPYTVSVSSDNPEYADCLNITLPAGITLERNSKTSFEISIENTCSVSHNLTFGVYAPSAEMGQYIFEYPSYYHDLNADSSAIILINVTSKSPPYGASQLTVFVYSSITSSSTNASIPITIIYSPKEISAINARMVELEKNVTTLRDMIDRVLPSEDKMILSLASKVEDAEELLAEAKASFDSGDYRTASDSVSEASDVTSGLYDLIDEKVDAGFISKLKSMVGYVIGLIIVVLLVLVWYMWLPEKSPSFKPVNKPSAESSESGSKNAGVSILERLRKYLKK